MSGPLAGIRVIDMTTVAMGPYATQILGDMGADVVKVESPDGDVFRNAAPARHPGMGAAFMNLNRNKRSIVLDLKRPDDKALMLELLDDADVFVSNTRPQALRKLGLDYESLRARNPRLVACGTYGFAEAGPYAGRPAFDDVIQAMSGLAALQGHNSGEGPEYVNTIMADKCAGLTAAWAIAMALYEREKSGLGHHGVVQPLGAPRGPDLRAGHFGHGIRARALAAPPTLSHARRLHRTAALHHRALETLLRDRGHAAARRRPALQRPGEA